jgi:lipooligosaccharide transport system permease protein
MITRRFIKIWRRNLIVYRKIWKISFIPPLLEPLFYLLAFGIGMGAMVGSVTYMDTSRSYSEFIAPALIAITIMYGGFFENTFASFVRMFYQKTFDAMLATPLCIDDIITGEIAWGATKSVIATVIMAAVITVFGLLSYPESLLLIPVAFIGGFAFGAIGMFFSGIVPSIETFNLPIFLFITPMFLFSGTFFPVQNLPQWAQYISLVFPLTHLVILVRNISYGILEWGMLWNLAYLLAFGALWFPLSLAVMRRRLIN